MNKSLNGCDLKAWSKVRGENRPKTQHIWYLGMPLGGYPRRATVGDRAFPVAAARAWNGLPLETLACCSLLTFRKETKSHLFRQS